MLSNIPEAFALVYMVNWLLETYMKVGGNVLKQFYKRFMTHNIYSETVQCNNN